MATESFCQGCGTALQAGSQFCASCGRRVTVAPLVPAWTDSTGLRRGTIYEHAGFWLRFGASFVDGLISIIVSFVFGFMVGFVLGSSGTTFVFVQIAVYSGQWAYFAMMESSASQATLGKIALGLIVTDDQYRPIGFGRATGRHFGKLISSIILGFGFFMIGWTARKQGLHDKMAGTLVVKKPSGYVRP